MRKSGIELLRIISLFAVIMIHYWVQASQYAEGLNYHSLVLFRSMSASAVDVFIIISGYFLCTTNKRTLGKPLNLIIQVSLINLMAYLIKSYFGIEPPISLRHITSAILPDSYYTTLFVVLYILSPYLNTMIINLSNKGWKILLFLSILIFSVYQTAFDLFSEVIGKEMMGLSPIGAWGAQNGFNIVNFTLLYIIGAFLRINPIKITKRNNIIGIVLCVLLIFGWSEFDILLGAKSSLSGWAYHNPGVILLAALLFLYFKDLSFSSRFINSAAKSVYTCFLGHCHIIAIVGIDFFVTKPLHYMILHFIVLSITCYIVFWFFWYIYDIITKSIYRRLDHKELRYHLG